MKRRVLLTAVWLGIVVYGLSLGTPLALAATSNNTSGQALEIAPPLLTLKSDPGRTVKATLQLRDITKSPLVVNNEINDFVANGEDGTPKILLGSSDANNPFSLKNWINPLPSFTLNPGKIATLDLIIDVPANASPGGHYGIIRFTGTPPGLNGSGVALSASLGALVLLTVNGNLKHDLSVASFTVDHNGKKGSFFESPPLNFTLKLKNNGNVQEQPTGHIVVSDMFGKAVAGVNVNLEQRNVLPASTRQFTAPLDKNNLGNKRLFGRYHAVITVTYAGGKKLTASLTFWVIPYKLIIGLVIGVIIAFFVLRYGIKRYNRYIVRKVQAANSRNKRR
ncbi:MAG TPA: hypothetical protein VHD60_01250 [Candidatus Saccharimonadales bacterium]|nr:hypothetical protein [Candidatus Saccharimonadales bacterium]